MHQMQQVCIWIRYLWTLWSWYHWVIMKVGISCPQDRFQPYLHIQCSPILRLRSLPFRDIIGACAFSSLHTKVRLNAGIFQSLGLFFLHYLLLSFLRCCKSSNLFLGSKLNRLRVVFPIQIDGSANRDVLAADGHDAGALHVAGKPFCGCGVGFGVWITCRYPLEAFGQNEVGWLTSII